MGLFKKRANEPSEIDRLREQITSMAARLDATDAVKQQLGAQVQGLVTRLDEPPPIPPPPAPTVHPDEFRALVSRVSEIGNKLAAEIDSEPEPAPPAIAPEELEELGARVEQLAERIEQVDSRITSVSNELANQITELSGEMEGLGTAGSDAEVVEHLRDTQRKLADEQARYQIAFRQDLAELADFLRHH